MGFTINNRDLERFSGFLGKDGGKILLYHNDSDGVSSAAMFLKLIKGFEAIPRAGPTMSDDFADELAKKEPGLVVFLDIPADQEGKKIKRLQKRTGCKIIIVDHHIYEKNLNSDDILHLNPRFKRRDAYISCAHIVYVILQRMGLDVKELCWIAAMGVIGDYAFDESKDFLDDCRMEYPYLLEKHPLESRLGSGANMINYAASIKGLRGTAEALKILVKSSDHQEFMVNKKLLRWKEEMERELDSVVRDAKKEEYDEIGLLIFNIKTRFGITSTVATLFSEKYPDSVIIVRKEMKHGWKLCLRNQSGRVNLDGIVKKCIKGIGSGGGHERAAGVVTTDWERFKKRFVSSLS
jgi:single-stranded DNA-specific DHH superfamily exonuclease